MSPVMSNTQEGLITVPAATDFSANVGLFAIINSSGNASLPLSTGLALYVIEDAFTTSGTSYQATLRPLSSNRNVRVIASGNITCGAAVVSNGLGKAVAASTGRCILGYAEEAGATGQYVLIRPCGGVQVVA